MVLEVDLDGEPADLRFEASDDFDAVASKWMKGRRLLGEGRSGESVAALLAARMRETESRASAGLDDAALAALGPDDGAFVVYLGGEGDARRYDAFLVSSGDDVFEAAVRGCRLQ